MSRSSAYVFAAVLLTASSHPLGALMAEESAATKVFEEGIASFQAAFDAHDVDAMLANWREDADLIDETGGIHEGREQIAAAYADLFERCPEATLQAKPFRTRVIGDTAIVDGVAHVFAAPGQSPQSSRFTVVYARTDADQDWQVASVREAPLEAESSRDKLEPLAWLVGDWVSESESGGKTFTTVNWSDDGEELRRTSLSSNDGSRRLIETRIVWNPEKGQIESTTREEGRLVEGVWSKSGDSWVVDATSRSLDGETVTAKYVMTPQADDAFAIEAIERKLGEEALPDVPKSTVKRLQ